VWYITKTSAQFPFRLRNVVHHSLHKNEKEHQIFYGIIVCDIFFVPI